MPLNGSGVASKPAGTTAVTGTTIESAKYNSVVDDLYAIQNTARPVVSGGTGATTALAAISNFGLIFTDCILQANGSDITLSRKGGKHLTINGDVELIPSAGVTLAPSALTPGTLYYIYAFMSSGTMTLEASATGHSTDTTTGLEIKTGDASRTLVGMVRPVTGPAFSDSATRRFVRSWYNRKPLSIRNKFTVVRSTTSTSWTEVNTEIRCEFLVWADEVADLGLHSSIYVTSSGTRIGTALTIDGVTIDPSWTNEAIPADNGAHPMAIRRAEQGLSEGYHYATLAGIVSANTGSWHSGITGVSNTTITGLIQTAGV